MSTRVDVVLPSLGDEDDTVTKATISLWIAKVGHALKVGDDLVEVTTDKAAFVVPSPYSGTLVEVHAAEGETVAVGHRLAVIEL